MNLGEKFNDFNSFLGNAVQKNNNIFTYNFFSNLLFKNALKKIRDTDPELKNFFIEGILKGPTIDFENIKKINSLLNDSNGYFNESKTQFFYELNEELKKTIGKIIEKDFENFCLHHQRMFEYLYLFFQLIVEFSNRAHLYL